MKSQTQKARPVVAISVNLTWNLANFRLGLIKALISAGYDVVAIAPEDEYVGVVEEVGCRFVDISIGRKSKNPLKDIALLFDYIKIIKILGPDVFLGYTVKPNIYGSLACRVCGVPVINNIAGLGAAFIGRAILSKVVAALYSLSLKKARTVFFQNGDDKNLFLDLGLVNSRQAQVIPGSGVNTEYFSPDVVPFRRLSDRFTFLVVARLLWDKGIGEFVEAARELKKSGVQAEFMLLGFVDADNPSGIKRDILQSWEDEGVVRYLGQVDDVRPYLAAVDCVVLPSYREGTPRSLLEAASMGKPIVTTDAPGCRDVVLDGVTGFLVQPKSADALEVGMRRLTQMKPDQVLKMGRKARQFVVENYDERLVIDAYLRAVERALVN